MCVSQGADANDAFIKWRFFLFLDGKEVKPTGLPLALAPRHLIFMPMKEMKRSRHRYPLMMAILLHFGLVAPALAACTDPAAAGVNWRRCYLDGRDLKQVTLKGAMLREATFMRSDLTGADLSTADAYRGKFVSATLARVVLEGARLIEADFTHADLTGAKLAGADLRNAKLVGARLTGADLTGVQIGGADLRNADLSGATWTDGAKICGDGSVGLCH
jgi:hypothetical protein